MSRTTLGQSRSRRVSYWLWFVVASCAAALAGCGGDGAHKRRNPAPIVTAIAPASATVGGAAFTLTVAGLDFVDGATVSWNGSGRTTTFVSGAQLTAAIPASDLVSVGTAQVTVTNPPPGGGTSSAITFTILGVPPTISSLNPSTVLAGSPAFDLSVNGSGFVAGATVSFNGTPRVTTFVNASLVRAAILASDVVSTGTAQVRVANPAPGGGTSAPFGFVVQSAAPVLGTLDPATLRAGSMSFDLVVTGSGFMPGATVLWGGETRATQVVSSTRLMASVSATDVARPGTVNVSVTNPAPTVGASNSLPFLVTEPPAPPPQGFPVLVTVAPDGSLPNGASVNGGMDWDGNYAIFASAASNLVAGDTNGAWDVFVRETCLYSNDGCTPRTRRVVLEADGSQPDGDSGWTVADPAGSLSVSFNGRYVAYLSNATNLVAGDTNGEPDVYLTDTCIGARGTCTAATVRASLRNDGSQSSLPAFTPAVSDDGRYVVFVSADPGMVAGDANGLPDVFLRDTCAGAGPACTPVTTRVSVADGGGDANGSSGEPAFTGRYVAFTSTASNLVAGDTNAVADVFLRDTCLGAPPACVPSTVLVSVGAGGEPANAASSDPQVGPPLSDFYGHEQHGRFVVFASKASNLVAGDTNGVSDVFERDLCRGEPGCTPSTARVSVTNGGGQIAGASVSPDFVRWDGEAVPFVTAADGVVPEDANGVGDVYLRYLCPFGAPSYCRASTSLVSVGAGAVLGDRASFAPRLNHDPWGVWVATFLSDATNLLPGAPRPTSFSCIYLTAVF